jgi:ethanolamine utilization protein EutN
MKLARVVGNVVSTFNAPIFEDRTLLLCDLIDPRGKPAGGYMIAVDTVGAGPGETVLLMDEGTSARQILGVKQGPVRTLVVGIVDDVALVPSEESAASPAPAPRARTAAPKATAAKPARRPRKVRPTP